MRRARVVVAALGLAATFSALSVSASAQTLYLFLLVGPLPALVLVLNDSDQVYRIEASSELRVICKHFGGRSLLSNGAAMYGATMKINGAYGKCIVEPGGLVASIAEVEDEIDAQGSASTLRLIDVNVPAVGCLITVGQLSTHLLRLLFLEASLGSALALLVHVNISGIHAHVNSTVACGTTSLLPTTGTYIGSLSFWVDGGSIRWHA